MSARHRASEPRPSSPAGFTPTLLRQRPSERRAVARANGRDPWRDENNLLAQLGAIALCVAVVLAVAIRGCV